MVDNYLEHVRWLDSEETAFGVRCIDCRPATRSLTSMTSDLAVAKWFSSSRSSSSEEFIRRVPESYTEAVVDIGLPLREAIADGPLYKAAEMEDKWDIYKYEEHICFTRSWTGDLIFRASIEVHDREFRMTQIHTDSRICS